MSITLRECEEKGGEIYNLSDTGRKVCVLPSVKKEVQKEKKAVLIN